jgi:4,5:9,10-diseco-3-hydroxy-5,9,17-trioxoandrosta-1(10),2-diene-4-oate hydrolase
MEMLVSDTIEITPRLVEAGDTTLALTESGDGFPLVWLHGSGPGATGMSNFRGNLPSFQDYRNLVFDHPRFGSSSRPSIEGPLIAHSGQRILAALDALGIEGFSLVGNSFGGGSAAWIAATVPQRVRDLVLMAPGGLTPKTVHGHADMPYGIQLIGKAMTEGVDHDLMQEFVSAMVYDQGNVTEALVDERLTAALKNNPEIEGIPNMGDISEMLPSITARTLIIWGREDKFLLPSWSLLWLEAINDAELHIFPRCGHWAQYEQLESFNRLTREFLAV